MNLRPPGYAIWVPHAGLGCSFERCLGAVGTTRWRVSDVNYGVDVTGSRVSLVHADQLVAGRYRTSVFAAMTKSLRCSPLILCVHHVTVVLPHSVSSAG